MTQTPLGDMRSGVGHDRRQAGAARVASEVVFWTLRHHSPPILYGRAPHPPHTGVKIAPPRAVYIVRRTPCVLACVLHLQYSSVQNGRNS